RRRSWRPLLHLSIETRRVTSFPLVIRVPPNAATAAAASPLLMQPPAELASSSPPVHRDTSSHFLPTCHSSAAKCGNSGGGVASAAAASPLVMQPPAELSSSSPPVHRDTSSHFLPTCHSSAAKCGNSGGGVASGDAAAGGAGVLFSTCPSRHVLELSEERQPPGPSTSGSQLPYFRHAHTHTGTVPPGRPSPLSAGPRASGRPEAAGAGGGGGRGGVGNDRNDTNSDNSEDLSDEDSFLMLEEVAPPPRKPPPPPSAPPGGGVRQSSVLLPPPPPRASGSRNGRLAEVAFVAHARGGGGSSADVDGVAPVEDGTGAGGGAGSEDREGPSLMTSTVLRRGTRALAPPLAPGTGLPSGSPTAPRTAAAASAVQCLSELLQLLRLLAEGDLDTARARERRLPLQLGTLAGGGGSGGGGDPQLSIRRGPGDSADGRCYYSAGATSLGQRATMYAHVAREMTAREAAGGAVEERVPANSRAARSDTHVHGMDTGLGVRCRSFGL
ncbi:hypothetical protein VOLCADRAFT_100859, partial [Volvox carteri f. nagariensis]